MKNDNYQLKHELKQFKDNLCQEFYQKILINTVINKLVAYVDQTILTLFHKHKLHECGNFCLLALGSYGRRELQLHSDIDLLLLHQENTPSFALQKAQHFIQDCWDVGLNISHQITTVNAYADLAETDLSAISSILDMHLICGRTNLMEQLHYQTHPWHMWPSEKFFLAKQAEQQQRYQKYRQTAYTLEPNVKYGPGGLRDLQLLLNIGKRHFGIKKLADGLTCGFFTDKEYEELLYCQHFLWRVRFALHALSNKQEERLLFDYQVKLAELFGCKDNKQSLAIEQFMKSYFKVIKRNYELTEMLLQWFAETIVYREKQQITPLDNHFQLSNQFIEVRNNAIFAQNPVTLLALFVWLAKRPSIKGVRANTIRLIRQHLYLLNKTLRASPTAIEYFLSIFQQANPYKALLHMNRYGVLGHYLDCFAQVTGQMQYDLFHAYTVDQHTLFVIRNINRFLKPKYFNEFPLAASLMSVIKYRDVLYLAALFHDIAKGRGGDHSELGAVEAGDFAQKHGLPPEKKDLLVWLVKQHLLMSQTAQRKDIYDPKTIHAFCNLLPEPTYLEYLYLLTVADICATNQNLWNSWKDSLLKELYQAAKQFLNQKQASIDEKALIQSRQQEALLILEQQGISKDIVEPLWHNFKGLYFLHESPEIIARHCLAILDCKHYPLVLIMPHHSQGGTEIFIYMPHRNDRFCVATTVLSNQHVTIQESTILTTENHFDLDIYIILDENHQAFFDEARTNTIRNELIKHLADHHNIPTVIKRRIPRTMAHFQKKPKISFNIEENQPYTRLFLVTSDRPGLLAQISRVFARQHIILHHAKIATAGERVEDMFYISTEQNAILSVEEQERLKEQLLKELSD